MSDNDTDTTRQEAPTRRDYMKYGGTIAVGGMLAGCAGDNTGAADDTPESSNNEETSNAEDADTETGTDEPEEWSVTLKPSGTMTFSEVPERFTVYSPAMGDIMTLLGQIDGLAAIRRPGENFPTRHFERLPGVEIDMSNVLDFFPGGADSADKEVFYEADPDINLIDPGICTEYLGMTEEDVEEIGENVAPFFGSDMRRRQLSEEHPYYSLYEGIEKFARAFQEMERFEAVSELREEFVSTVELPDVSEREWESFMIGHGNWWEDFSEFFPARATAPGYSMQPFHDLGFEAENNAFGDVIPDGDPSVTVDKEAVLEADPEIIIWYGGTLMNQDGGWDAFGTNGQWEEDVVQAFKDDPVLSEVTAVQEDRIVPTGTYGGGPVKTFFVTEDLAKALYPEEFGEFKFRGYSEDEQIFDHQRLADIINGDF